MSKDLEEMEVNSEAAATEKKRWVQKPFTQEQMDSIAAGVEAIKANGASEKFCHILDACADWRNPDEEVKKNNRNAMSEAFGGKVKEYLQSEEFKAEAEPLMNIAAAMQVVGQIKTYAGRTTYTPKVKLKRVSINNTIYEVNPEYLESIRQEANRTELLLAHPDTKKYEEDIEEF